MGSSGSNMAASGVFIRSARLSCLLWPKCGWNKPVIFRCLGIESEALVYSQHGDPDKVLSLENVERSKLSPTSMSIQMLAAPINPADINQIQGVYALKPPLPAVGGNEGTGEVIQVGSEVETFQPGDRVVLTSDKCLGSWCRHLVVTEEEVLKIPSSLSLDAAATVSVNPCTAFRILKDFEDLMPGDTVIQNGANSGAGQALIQIAAAWGLKTVNIIRDRPNLEELRSHLSSLGASYVVTEENLKGSEMKEVMKSLNPPKLAVNCVGGKSSMQLFRFLGPKGTMVTYGGMSKQPVSVPTGSLIFKDVNVRGFWMSQWNIDNNKGTARVNMLEEVCSMLQDGLLRSPPCTRHSLTDYKAAISEAMKPYTQTKQLLILKE